MRLALTTHTCLLALLSSVSAKDPKELLELDKVQTELEQRAINASRVKYREALKRMVQDFTKAGKLEEATAANRKLAFTSYGGSWYSFIAGKPNGWLAIFPDGTAGLTTGFTGKWQVEGDGIKIVWGENNTWTMLVGREKDPLTGKAFDGTPLRFQREKPE